MRYNELEKEDTKATVLGDVTGLRKTDFNLLERLYRRRIPPDKVVSPEAARFLAELSSAIQRQIAILVHRSGAITHVIVGDASGIFIPDLAGFPLGKKALRGLRLIHTHLKNEPLNQDDLTDLLLLRFDVVAAIGIRDGLPANIYVAGIMPEGSHEVMYEGDFYGFNLNFDSFVSAREEEMDRRRLFSPDDERERAILVSVSQKPKYIQEDSLDELEELALSSNVVVLGRVIQRPKEIHPKYLIGSGKIKDAVIGALAKGSTMLIFDQDLLPAQSRAIADITELKVIDRSQLILDIFARRAHSSDGKVQVELAQLKYRLPRLTGKGTDMSRLMGGIGGRGPGEMKLEIDRRRVRERIGLLEKQLRRLSKARNERKRLREDRAIPIVSIVGYTNAGKSTLLNKLTKSETFVEDKLFATLDTASRRLRFPREREIIITDTVGFIRDLPRDLMTAFKATLEELEDADMLLHLVDISNPRFEQQIDSVEKILNDLHLGDKSTLLVFNKIDKTPPEEAESLVLRFNAIPISAKDPATFSPLLSAIERTIFGPDNGHSLSEKPEEEQIALH
ncbi:MAG: GTPase HflX [bacterium]